MSKALLLGAGLVARPLVQYLLAQPEVQLTVADLDVERAASLVGGHANGRACRLAVSHDPTQLAELVADCDLAISLLPKELHPVVARACLAQRTHLVTASYVGPEMQALDGPARDAGVLLLNEIGLDPGIDHLSAMRVIDDIRSRGGRVVEFRSCCGGLPAPDANDNPWGYKFSWSPRGVCSAGKSAARYLLGGKTVEIPGSRLFTDCEHGFLVKGVGYLEAYPNRDSLSYIETYGLQGVQTMFRGTLRYPGWCATFEKIVQLGLLDESPITLPARCTYAEFLSRFVETPTGNLRFDLAHELQLDPGSLVLDRFQWLGLLSAEPVPAAGTETTALDVLAGRMAERMAYHPGERDMVVLCHDFVAELPGGKREHTTSQLVAYGEPEGDSAMARTVGLPAAVAAKLILTGRVQETGVHVPVAPVFYNPILDELASLGIKCEERTEVQAG